MLTSIEWEVYPSDIMATTLQGVTGDATNPTFNHATVIPNVTPNTVLQSWNNWLITHKNYARFVEEFESMPVTVS